MIKKLLLILFMLAGILRAHAQVPVADFSSTVTSGCAPLAVSFTDQSSGSPKFWNWDFGNGQLSNLQNPVASFNTPGTYSVTLVARNADGTNGITKTNYITVYPSPSASFVATTTIGCAPSVIQFNDRSTSSTGSIVKWGWDFGDGGTSTGPNPAHQYTVPGYYTVILTVTSSTGCTSAIGIPRYIRIVAGVVPEFNFSNPATCRAPFNVPFTNLTSGPGALTYSWDFGNSTGSTQDNPVAAYAASGTYNITLQATSEYGCSGTIQKSVAISGTNTSFTSPDTVCLNSTVNFQNTPSLTPKSTFWDFGNGLQSPKLNDTSTYHTPGVYSVKLINVYDDCKDSTTRPLVVMDIPVVDFTAPITTACKAPLTVNFQDVSPDAVSWLWDFGDGNTATQQNPSHIYATEGSYNVTLAITTHLGCTNTITKPAFVRIVKPTVTFNNAPDGGCIPFSFTPAAVANAIDGVTSYFWEYGDAGFTATTSVPTGPLHTYANQGVYGIKVTITTTGGCTATADLPTGIMTGVPPVANFSSSAISGCASDSITFTDLSTPVPGVNQWRWDFGDGTTSTDQSPKHGFRKTGPLTVRLTAYNNLCPSIVPFAQPVTISAPIADFDYTVSCPNLVNFTDKSITDPALGTPTYTWNFGDPGNTPSASPNTSFSYPSPGNYTAKLTVVNGACSFTYSEEIKLSGSSATFNISKATVCKNDTVTLTSPFGPADIKYYEWAFDGVNFDTAGQVVTVSYPTAGPHTVALRITDINGCHDTKTGVITVAGPTAGFTPAIKGGCSNTVITFNDLSTANTGIGKWTFDFGDGQTQDFTAAPFNHTYAGTGSFVVKLTVTDNTGCTDTYTSTDTIMTTKPLPGFKANFTTICPKTDITFTDTSGGEGLHYLWDFGDGNTSTSPSPVHQYTATSGNFTVKLVLTDTTGCMDSVTRTNYIKVQAPKPAFEAQDTSTICQLLETKFSFKGTDYQSFFWDFGDGTTSTLENPKHFYNTYGTYEAKLYVVGYGGCVDSVSDTIHIYDPFSITNIGYTAAPSCNPIWVDFSVFTPPSTTFTFFFGDGNVDSSLNTSLQHYYKDPGAYAPYVSLRDSTGCQVNVGGATNISIIGAVPYFGADTKSFCDSNTVFFTDFTLPRNAPLVSRTWDFGDGGTSSVPSPSHLYNRPGTFIVSQTVTDLQNCTNTITDTIRVYGTPSPIIGGDTVACINNTLLLPGTLAVPDTAIVWKWDLGSNGQSSNQNVSVKYAQAGNYTVSLEATNKLGCKDTTSKSILVPQTPVVTVTNNAPLVVGTGINMPVTYSAELATYAWTPSTNLSCTDCPVPFANPKFTTKYNVKVTDIYGCSADQDITITVVCNGKNYFVPNTFSPNGDGVNDVFMPRGSSISRVSRMQIFNRWGETVYEKKDFMVNDASAGWNGTYKGKPANADVYIYVVEFVCENASIIPYRGNVTLIR